MLKGIKALINALTNIGILPAWISEYIQRKERESCEKSTFFNYHGITKLLEFYKQAVHGCLNEM